jgi:hypothetical protein
MDSDSIKKLNSTNLILKNKIFKKILIKNLQKQKQQKEWA